MPDAMPPIETPCGNWVSPLVVATAEAYGAATGARGDAISPRVIITTTTGRQFMSEFDSFHEASAERSIFVATWREALEGRDDA